VVIHPEAVTVALHLVVSVADLLRVLLVGAASADLQVRLRVAATASLRDSNRRRLRCASRFPAAGRHGSRRDVNTTLTMVLSIITLACCCTPLGVVSLINGDETRTRRSKRAISRRLRAKNKTALTMAIIGMVGGVIIWTAVIILQVAANPHAF